VPGSLPSTQASVRSEESKPKWAGSHHRLLDTKIDLGSFVQFSVQTMMEILTYIKYNLLLHVAVWVMCLKQSICTKQLVEVEEHIY